MFLQSIVFHTFGRTIYLVVIQLLKMEKSQQNTQKITNAEQIIYCEKRLSCSFFLHHNNSANDDDLVVQILDSNNSKLIVYCFGGADSNFRSS